MKYFKEKSFVHIFVLIFLFYRKVLQDHFLLCVAQEHTALRLIYVQYHFCVVQFYFLTIALSSQYKFYRCDNSVYIPFLTYPIYSLFFQRFKKPFFLNKSIFLCYYLLILLHTRGVNYSMS